MRLAFVTAMASTPWGGCEDLWASTAARARASGHGVLASPYHWNPPHPDLVALGRSGVRLAERPRGKLLRRVPAFAALARAFDPLRAFRPDAVCISQGGTYDVARSSELDELWAIAAAQGWPYVLLCHCEQAPPVRRAQLARAKSIFAGAAIPGFLSRDLAQRTERDLGIELPRARVFQNPLRVSDRPILPWPADPELRLGCVARLHEIKGLDLLLDVLGAQPWRERHWRLDICGTGPERNALERRSHALGLADRVRFLGQVPDINAFWRDRQLLVMPSRAEGVPLAMQEAMLLGRPVVASRTGGIADWIDEDEAGWLLSAPTSAALGAALERAWHARARLPVMGEEASRRTRARLDPDPAGTLLRWLESLARELTGDAAREPSALIIPA
jgi:glycosyltransferase involved in cell wall biosynthesis